MSLPSSKILTSPLAWDWGRIWSYLAALHNTAKLLCPCSLSCHACLAAPRRPALLWASPGPELGTL